MGCLPKFLVYLPPDGITDGIPDGIPEGITDGTPDGITDGIIDGIPDEIPDGINDGIPDGITDGIIHGVSPFRISIALCFISIHARTLMAKSPTHPGLSCCISSKPSSET
jgi:hypothetical protein